MKKKARYATRRVAVGFLVVGLAAGAVSGLRAARSDRSGSAVPDRPRFASNDPIARACDLDEHLLDRIQRGHDPVRSEDITIVPRKPNFIGTFTLTSHSGPWNYLQQVPLVLYGPGFIRAHPQRLDEPAEIADVYPTMAQLLDAPLPARHGRVLEEALEPERTGTPKLVVTVVWDGAGSNTLARWPRAWPTLRRLERSGTSYANATVGASPSITSVVHSTLGTGSLPREHGITGNDLRTKDGSLRKAFSNFASTEMRLSTFADEIDLALDNEPKVGLLGWKNWHLGMMSHGASLAGGDRDQAALIKFDNGVKIFGNDEFFELPDLEPQRPIEDHIEELDREDGRVDGKWMGRDISLDGKIFWATYSNPAWAAFQSDMLISMIEQEGYGDDDVPDLLFTNFKMTDLAAHLWSVDAPEMESVLRAQDHALEQLVAHLDAEVGDYVLLLTADHGVTPLPERTGAWPINQRQLVADVDRRFDAPKERSLIEASAAFGYFLDQEVADELDVSAYDVARYLNGYTILENWDEDDLPPGYENRGGEHVFSAAFPPRRFGEIRQCVADNQD